MTALHAHSRAVAEQSHNAVAGSNRFVSNWLILLHRIRKRLFQCESVTYCKQGTYFRFYIRKSAQSSRLDLRSLHENAFDSAMHSGYKLGTAVSYETPEACNELKSTFREYIPEVDCALGGNPIGTVGHRPLPSRPSLIIVGARMRKDGQGAG